MLHDTETLAHEVADELGRDWNDCGEYERESYRDEARRRRSRNELRNRLAKIIHDSWSVEAFDASKHPEDITAADAVMNAFPQFITEVSGQAKVPCKMCDGTGYKDHAGFAMDPCDHSQRD